MKIAGAVLIIVSGCIGIIGGCSTVFVGAVGEASHEMSKDMGEIADAYEKDMARINKEHNLTPSEMEKLAIKNLREVGDSEDPSGVTKSIMSAGGIAMVVSFLVFIIGILSFWVPVFSGILSIAGGLVMFICANFLTGPLAILGGAFCVVSARRSSGFVEMPD